MIHHLQKKSVEPAKKQWKQLTNRPFPSSLVLLSQSESKCETILMKMTLICMKMKLHAELIFIWKVSFLISFWNRGTRELGNGLWYWWFSRHANKLNYHASEKWNHLPFNILSQEIEYRRRVINKQRAKVSGMCDIPNSSYSSKGFTENYRV